MKISNTHHKTKSGLIKRNPPKSNSSNKKVIYAGHWKGEDSDNNFTDLSFSLYSEEEINFEITKQNILNNMNKNHLPKVRELFSHAGLLVHRFDYYSPSSYNYEGDSMDLEISIRDKVKLKRFILSQRKDIQAALDSNKSYDGYIALTQDNIEDVFKEIDETSEVDPMVINYILSKYVELNVYSDFYDLFVNEPYEDDE